MRRVALARLLDGNPGGVWSASDQMAWHPARGIAGVSLARRLSAESVVPLASVVDSLRRKRAGIDAFVLDASRVQPDGCNEVALDALRRSVIAPLAGSPRVRELRVVASSGLSQIALVGVVALAAPRAWRVVPSLERALAPPGDDEPLPAWADELLSTLNSELTPMGVVSQVRAQLGLEPSSSLEQVAERLRMSPRTLQRSLGEAATTFANERLDLRLELAASRLSKTADKIRSIATECGYRSLSHFTQVFRARYGLAPSAFRARRRQLGEG